MQNSITINRPVRLKPIAIPTEHGSWGFLLEPLVAGIAIASSTAAPWIALMACGAFLARQPLKIYLADVRAGRRLPQTDVALKLAMGFGLAAAIGAVGLVATGGLFPLFPLVIAAPFAGYQIYRDMLRKSRGLVSELLAAAALASTAAVVTLAAGWTIRDSLLVWFIFAARFVPSIVYVRSRLLLEKGKDWSRTAVYATNIFALAAIVAIASVGLIPALPAGIFAVLTIRALVGVSKFRKKVKAVRIGVFEVIYGALLVAAVIIGYVGGI